MTGTRRPAHEETTHGQDRDHHGRQPGLGRSAALRLAEDGVDLIITYRTHAEEAAEVVDAATGLGRTAYALRLDTGRIEDFDAFADEVQGLLKDGWGRESFDYLVNNAGAATMAPLTDTAVEDFDLMMNVHFRGVYLRPAAVAGRTRPPVPAGRAQHAQPQRRHRPRPAGDHAHPRPARRHAPRS